uniref:Peptidase C1A papain C-terminal domain-containing protein n=1 Tax=Tetradesmus obliquus TaxID=3088 RepID=A0A383W6G3_TETOB|eukprot:jgi/Sobl393_1/3718/SZX73238.1
MVQLQLSSYILATTPAVYRTPDLPNIRNQGSCSTCVAQAAAAAIQMAMAAAWKKRAWEEQGRPRGGVAVSQWDVSAHSLYYCSLQGRSCKTGWDIPDALKTVIDQKPELVRPSSCLTPPSFKDEVGFTGWRSACDLATKLAEAGACPGQRTRITREQPWMNCVYKSMSSFVEIQEHIRLHGSVISRIIIYDDFQVQFTRSAKFLTSDQLPPYQRNLTAKPAFGHAVVIVGYDNNNYTWTAMNSWGDRTSKSRPGVTADGLFRIQMGIGDCGGLGVAACTLHYKDVNVTETLPPGTFVQLCDTRFATPGEIDKIAFFRNIKTSQQRALNAWEVTIREYAGAEQYQPDGVQCGITGPVPPEWYTPTINAQGAPLTPAKSLQVIDISGNKLSGSLPDITAWKNLQLLFLSNNQFNGPVPSSWASVADVGRGITTIDLQSNRLSGVFPQISTNSLIGSIPPSYANLSKLKFLDVSGNVGLTGQLPPEFGSAGKMPIDAVFYLGYTALTGPIPLSWSYFSLGIVDVSETAVNISCIPDGLQVYPSRSPSCSGSSPQVSSLSFLKQLIQKRGGVSTALATWNSSDIGGAGPKTPPKYCRLWTGITCDSAYQVIGLNLTALSIQLPPTASLNITAVVEKLLPLTTTLRVLDAAALQLVGDLPKVLATFSKLEALNLSGNKGLAGNLPSIWSALTALRTVDLSSTSISGNLPPSWASLQELRVFRAANCSGLSGQLPLEWGILRSLEELVVTNSELGGALPAWTDAGAVRAAGAAVLAAAEQTANDAGSAGLSPASVERSTRTVRYNSGHVAPQALAAAANRAVTAIKATLAAAPAGTRFMPLRIIDLSGNKLRGQLVLGWSLFEQLQMLILSRNSLSGPLPDGYARLTTLTALDLSGNSFAGLLPSTWVSMRQLVLLDVSGNALASPTPETLPYMAGEGFSLKCLVLAGNAGMDAAELASIKEQMEADSGGRVTVVVARSGRTCGISVLGV